MRLDRVAPCLSGDAGAAGLELGEELVYLLTENLLALQEGVTHALDDLVLLAQERLDLLPGLGEYLVRLLAYLPVSQERPYRGAGKLVWQGAQRVEFPSHPEETDHRCRRPRRLPEVGAYPCRGLPEPDLLGRASR